MVKSSVDLYFGAVWMWDKVARILLQSRKHFPALTLPSVLTITFWRHYGLHALMIKRVCVCS